jgi:anti-anti-sigma factor
MEQSINYQDGMCVITLSGRFDSVAAPLFDRWLDEHETPENIRYLLDMQDVPYITSAGLRSILKLHKLAEGKGGRVALCSVVPAVQDLFNMAGFSTFLKLYDARESALEDFSA